MKTSEIIRMIIQSWMGLPYKWGGDDPLLGFDCSGAILELLHSCGLPPLEDTTAQGIYNQFSAKKTFGAQFGSLAFYGEAANKITHVAFCLNEGFVFEFGGGGSKTKTREDAGEQNAYGRVRPLHRRGDLVALVNPPWPQYG